MASPATELKYLRRILQDHADEFLRLSGMDFYHDRIFYKYTDEAIFFTEFHNSAKSDQVHWKCLGCVLHIHYRYYPKLKKTKMHESGNPIPNYMNSHYRLRQLRTLDQSALGYPTDISSINREYILKLTWQVLEDESNLTEVLQDIATAIKNVGLPEAQQPKYSRDAMLKHTGRG